MHRGISQIGRFTVNYRVFGDSYDIVKQSMFRWLSSHGKWAVHPMFTDEEPARYADAYRELLGVDRRGLVAPETIRRRLREYWITPAMECKDHLFIDPDTGLRAEIIKKHPNRCLLLDELKEIAKADGRKNKLTLVFDQSIDRSEEGVQAVEASGKQLRDKLDWLKHRCVHGVAYKSHANFVLVSANKEVVRQAVDTIREKSRLPSSRFVCPPSHCSPDCPNRVVADAG